MAGIFPALSDIESIRSGLLYTRTMSKGNLDDIVGNAILQIRPKDVDSDIINLPVIEYGVLLNFSNTYSISADTSFYRIQIFASKNGFYYRIFDSSWGLWVKL